MEDGAVVWIRRERKKQVVTEKGGRDNSRRMKMWSACFVHIGASRCVLKPEAEETFASIRCNRSVRSPKYRYGREILCALEAGTIEWYDVA